MSALKRWKRARSGGEWCKTWGCCLHELNWLNHRQKNMFTPFCCYWLQLFASRQWNDLLASLQHILCLWTFLFFYLSHLSFYIFRIVFNVSKNINQTRSEQFRTFYLETDVAWFYLPSHADTVWHKGIHSCKFMENYWFVINPACVASAELCSCSWIFSVFPHSNKISSWPVCSQFWNLSKPGLVHWRWTKHFLVQDQKMAHK